MNDASLNALLATEDRAMEELRLHQMKIVQHRLALESLHVMDMNKDSVVTKEEFLASGGSEQEFNWMDRNKDSVLDAAELEMVAADQLESGDDMLEQLHQVAACLLSTAADWVCA